MHRLQPLIHTLMRTITSSQYQLRISWSLRLTKRMVRWNLHPIKSLRNTIPICMRFVRRQIPTRVKMRIQVTRKNRLRISSLALISSMMIGWRQSRRSIRMISHSICDTSISLIDFVKEPLKRSLVRMSLHRSHTVNMIMRIPSGFLTSSTIRSRNFVNSL